MGSARYTVAWFGIWGIACTGERGSECTSVVEGVHTQGALGGHARVRDVIWENTEGYTRFTVEGLDAEVQSVSVSVDQEDVGVWVAKPDVPSDSENIWDYFDLGTYWTATVELAPYQLEPYISAGVDALDFVAATPEAMPWRACIRLDTSPYLLLDEGPAVPLGGTLALDHDVWDESEDVVIYPEGELPPWASWDERTGRVTGTATTPGIWEFTVVAEGEGGRRELPSGIASYQPTNLECGERASFTTDRGTQETPWAVLGDPRSFGAFETPLPRSVSAVTLRAGGLEFSRDAFVELSGAASWGRLPFREVDPVDAADLEVRLDPSRWPSLREVRAVADRLRFRAGNRHRPVADGMVRATCDDVPRLDLLALPVLPAGEAAVWELPAVGGRGAVRWEAHDLPGGVTLGADGRLAWAGLGDWSHRPIELVLTDGDGVVTTESVDLFHGDEAAVAGPILRCGERWTGTLGGGSSAELFLETAARRSGRVELAVTYTSPGGELRVSDPNGEWTLDPVLLLEDEPIHLVLDEESTVPLSSYAERPIGLDLRPYGESTTYSVALGCGSTGS